MTSSDWDKMSECERYLTGVLVGLCLTAEDGYVHVPTQLCAQANAHTLHIQLSGGHVIAWVTAVDEVTQ